MTAPHLRTRARERALQFLFGLEFTHDPWEERLEAFWDVCPTKLNAKAYAGQLIADIMARRAALDHVIDSCAEHWSPQRIGRLERNICRIALCELACRDDVPRKVAINEALELAKAFAADESPKFVNAILDRVSIEELRAELAKAG